MAIIIKSSDWKLPQYKITPGDKNGDYTEVQCLNSHLYDDVTGEPINDVVKEMDSYIDKKTWNPEKFDELWSKLNESNYFISDLY